MWKHRQRKQSKKNPKKTQASGSAKEKAPKTSTDATPPPPPPPPLRVDRRRLRATGLDAATHWRNLITRPPPSSGAAGFEATKTLPPELVFHIDEAMISHRYRYPAPPEDDKTDPPPETILRGRFSITPYELRLLEWIIRDADADVETTISNLTRRIAYASLFFLDETPVDNFTTVELVAGRLSLGLDKLTIELWRSVWKRDSYETDPTPLESFLRCLLSDYRVDEAKAKREYQFGTCADPTCGPCRAILEHTGSYDRVLLGGRGSLYERFSPGDVATLRRYHIVEPILE